VEEEIKLSIPQEAGVSSTPAPYKSPHCRHPEKEQNFFVSRFHSSSAVFSLKLTLTCFNTLVYLQFYTSELGEP